MTDFEILFCVVGILICVVGVVHMTITYRSITQNIDPDPERVRELLERAPLQQQHQGAAEPQTKAKVTIRKSTAFPGDFEIHIISNNARSGLSVSVTIAHEG